MSPGVPSPFHLTNGKRGERESSSLMNSCQMLSLNNPMGTAGSGISASAFCQPKLSPCSPNSQRSHDLHHEDEEEEDQMSDFDKCSEIGEFSENKQNLFL